MHNLVLIETISKIYAQPDWRPPGAPAWPAAINKLLDAGLITHHPQDPWYVVTPGGIKFVEMLKSTPFPVRRVSWTDPRTVEAAS